MRGLSRHWINRFDKYRWLRDLAEERPEEIGISFALIFFGLRALATNLTAAPGTVQALPTPLAVIYCIFATFGGCAVLFGLVTREKYLWAYGFELMGLFLSASAWSCYIIGIILGASYTSKSTLLLFALMAMTISSIVRARSVTKKNKAMLNALRSRASFEER